MQALERTGFICQPCLTALGHKPWNASSVQHALLSTAATLSPRKPVRKRDGVQIQQTRNAIVCAPQPSQRATMLRDFADMATSASEPLQGARDHKLLQPRRPARPAQEAARKRQRRAALKTTSDEHGFDVANRPPGSSEFWATFDRTWTEAAKSPPNRSLTRRQTQGVRNVEDQRIELQQLVYVTRSCDTSRRTEVKAQFRAWKRRFNDAYEAMAEGQEASFPWPRKLIGEDKLLALLGLPDVEKMEELWHQEALEAPETLQTLWANVMLAALCLRPNEAHLVLRATFDEASTPSYAVEDVVQYLARRSASLCDEERHRATAEVVDLVLFLLENTSNRYIQLRQWVVYTLIQGMETDLVARLYEELVRYDHLLHTNTLLQFAGRLAGDVRHKTTSTQVLEALLKTGTLDINTPRGAALCTSILTMKKDDVGKDIAVSPAELFERLLDLGLKPNLLTYTVIIRNLCLSRNLRAAWQVFETTVEHNIKPDAHLYAILLDGAKLCQDFSSIHRVAHAAHADNIRDPVIWNDLLHALFLPYLIEARERRIKPPHAFPAFRPMLKAYAKFFRLDPLRSLTFSDLDDYLKDEIRPGRQWQADSKVFPLLANLPALEPQDLIEPRGDTLGIMLMGYVGGFSKAYNIIAFHSQFRSLLQRGDSAAVRIVEEQGTLVYDLVIKAILEWDGLLHVALEVVSDMLKSAQIAAVDPSALPHGAGNLARHPAPSIYTWSILLDGFMHHRKIGEAERILRMMREYGVEPTIVTWNTLLAGYTREQRVERTVKTFQRIEAAGLEPTDFTFRAFSYLGDKERALQRMEDMVARRKLLLEKEQGQGLDGSRIAGQLQQLEGGVQQPGGERALDGESIPDQLRQLEHEAETLEEPGSHVDDEDCPPSSPGR